MSAAPAASEAVVGRAPWWARPALAWSLLTILPAPRVERVIGGASAFFPLIGLLLGATLGGLSLLLAGVLPAGPTVVLLLVASALLTGGLHLDGLMDTADGVFGGRTRERRLEIMRDSRVGAFGVVAAGLALLGQYACLVEMSGLARALALVLALTASRWTMSLALALFPAARPDGLGASARGEGGVWPLVAATPLPIVVALLVGPLGLAALAAAAGVALAGGWLLTRRLGGLTGDTYGALAVVAETLILYVAVG